VRLISSVLLGLVAAAAGCFARDPLDPLGALDHQAVSQIAQAERAARSRVAYERARRRVERVKSGTSVAEVEVAMGAVVVREGRADEKDEGKLPREKLIDGFLCAMAPSALRKRWLFGYDEGGVELIGFAVEFERDDPEDEDWAVRRVDREPGDECS
jgi:hypothetical protein